LSGGAMPPNIALLFDRPLERVVRLPRDVPTEAAWMLPNRHGAEACLFLNETTVKGFARLYASECTAANTAELNRQPRAAK
jgi:hypothetical protein